MTNSVVAPKVARKRRCMMSPMQCLGGAEFVTNSAASSRRRKLFLHKSAALEALHPHAQHRSRCQALEIDAIHSIMAGGVCDPCPGLFVEYSGAFARKRRQFWFWRR